MSPKLFKSFKEQTFKHFPLSKYAFQIFTSYHLTDFNYLFLIELNHHSYLIEVVAQQFYSKNRLQ